MSWTPTVISAAAGSGKTTRLVQEYLGLLAAGYDPARIIAITFTRAAAAELIERVALSLRAGLGDRQALDRLGMEFECCYRPHLPTDRAAIRRALRGLMNAPAGTTDSFVQSLLSEFALDAALAVGPEELAGEASSPWGADSAAEQGLTAADRPENPDREAVVSAQKEPASPAPMPCIQGGAPPFESVPLPEARYPASGGRPVPSAEEQAVPLDLPIALGDSGLAFQVAVREVIDPPDGEVPPEARRCLRHLTLGQLMTQVAALAADLPQGRLLGLADLLPDIHQAARRAFLDAIEEDPKLGEVRGCKVSEQKEAISGWLSGDRSLPAPPELLHWMLDHLDSDAIWIAPLQRAMARAVALDLGVAHLVLGGVLKAWKGWRDPAAVEAADQLRRDLVALAQRARRKALTLAAEGGALDYKLLTEAAIHLCRHAPDRLRSRFQALLVDEMQDANPDQMRLYQALAELPKDGGRLRTIMVGDLRQSIFLFRHAEPRIFEALIESARREGCLSSLDTNRRSTPSLVEAQKELFGAAAGETEAPEAVPTGDSGLAPNADAVSGKAEGSQDNEGRGAPTAGGGADLPGRLANGLPGVSSIDQVQASFSRADRELGPAQPWREPVVIVKEDAPEDGMGFWKMSDADAAAIDAFVERIEAAWKSLEQGGEGRPQDTAAVLCSTWNAARMARDRLRTLLGQGAEGERAFLDGSRDLLCERVAADLRILLQALWNPTNRLAWAAVFRLPCVGLSDGALALLDSGRGLRADGNVSPTGLTGAVWASGLDNALHPTADVATFSRVAPPLRRALQRIGREPTADVIEELVAALRWRAILLAGPDGEDGVAHLEVLLDWIRQAEQEGVDPDRLLDLLDPAKGEEDLPRLNLERGVGTVSCTTVYQAKGLAWDHVCVLSIGTSPAGGSGGGWGRVGVGWKGEEAHLLGVRMDPEGGITSVPDPIDRITAQAWEVRRNEERLRMAYVAITRAVRSVTFGLIPGGKGIHGRLYDLWTEVDLPQVCVEPVTASTDVKLVQAGHALAVAPFQVEPARPRGWQLVAPSMAHEHWSAKQREELVDRIAQRCEVLPGGPPIPLPYPEWDLDRRERGIMVHGWLADRGLTAGVTKGEAEAYLRRQWGSEDDRIASWLVRLSTELQARQPWLWEALADPGCRTHYEVPFVGVDDLEADDRRMYSGSIDLLLVRPGRRVWIVDFKGQGHPTGHQDVRQAARLARYAPQLEAYRLSVERAGYRVERLGLLFMGACTWVGW
ncbi:MAG: UvrD-helicase domain-containing protein [Bradymonadales bacterium]|nr:UvrD-helicase domain-containing protein [Bradymonadales bacterium]